MQRMARVGMVMVLALTACSGRIGGQGVGRPGVGAGLDRAPGLQCNQATIEGTWGIQIQGTRPSGPEGETESVIGVVLRTYDGRGNFTQIDNVHGSATGIVRDRPGWGTYTVDANCSVVTFLQLPGPPFTLDERGVIVDRGQEMRGIVAVPLPVSSMHRKCANAALLARTCRGGPSGPPRPAADARYPNAWSTVVRGCYHLRGAGA